MRGNTLGLYSPPMPNITITPRGDTMENLKFLHLTWNDIQRLTENVAKKIDASGFKPDIVVAISRGGFDPARIICDQLGIRRLASVQLESYEGMSRSREPAVVLPVNADLHGKRALLVDDVSDSGASIMKARDHLLENGAGEVRVLTLHIKPWSKFKPDYYADETDKWVVYPWEIKECILVVTKNIRESGLKGEDVVNRLIDMGFKRREVNKYLTS
jgi:hypoxanthine phosphoribosyltransferase